MSNPINLVLTAVVSLAVGVGGTYATIHVTATCDPVPAQPTAPSRFFDTPLLPTNGYPKY
jgi:hypothetical protein